MISITDNPIENECQDLLKVKRHSQALSNFILKSDAPLTIGLQGEWGSGKTSLMYLLREKLQTEQIATAWVNTWEYSMFRGPRETTPAILQGLLVKLREACGSQWTLNDEAKEKWKSVVRFAGALGNQVLVSKTGLDARSAMEDASLTNTSKDLLSGIADLKAGISEIIGRLIADPKNDYKRVVFFVDDLDRINPVDAVEVLEALKNVFDIPNCIFVLAIDYDVVVKGLEGKFGPKTEENEREFRSFFDKIIQLPFSMPTGTYDIDNFLIFKLKDLGVELEIARTEIFGKVVKYTVGYNPRSLKRYINSFSLLNSIRIMDEDLEEPINTVDELMLFALLGIQISYPKIFRMLITNPNYLAWDSSFVSKLGLNWDSIKETIERFGDGELTDEDWEKVIWGSCQRDPYLRSRATSILELMNLLRDHFKDSVIDSVERALEIAAITSVDDNAESKQAFQKCGNRIHFDSIDAKLIQLNENKINPENIELWRYLWEPLERMVKEDSNFQINFAKTACTLYYLNKEKSKKQILYVYNPSKKLLGMRIYIRYSDELIEKVYKHILSYGKDIPKGFIKMNLPGELVLENQLAGLFGKQNFMKIFDEIHLNCNSNMIQ